MKLVMIGESAVNLDEVSCIVVDKPPIYRVNMKSGLCFNATVVDIAKWVEKVTPPQPPSIASKRIS